MSGGQCDNRSAGVIIRGADGRYLVFDRGTFPWGTAPAAGHVDEHGGYEDAARAEVAEELGLKVTSLERVTGGWRDNKCRRKPGPAGTGHYWVVYLAAVEGDLDPSPRETRNARWLSGPELQALTGRTIDRAHGRLSAAAFAARPGIEPVWVQWLTDARVTGAGSRDLAAVDQLAAGIAIARGSRGPDYECRLVRDFGTDRPPIVCLCGSTRFYDAFRAANLRLTLAGEIVLSIGCDTKSDGDLAAAGELSRSQERVKADLDALHKRKIDLADYVLVLNVGGYVGESTRSEIAYAIEHGKPVRWLETAEAVTARAGDQS